MINVMSSNCSDIKIIDGHVEAEVDKADQVSRSPVL